MTNFTNQITWKYVNTKEMEKVIKSLKNKKSSGYDGISSAVIKQSAPFIVSPLTYICNEILKTGTYPDRLKYAVVRSIFKKGS